MTAETAVLNRCCSPQLRSGELEVAKEAERRASTRNLGTYYYGACDVSTVSYCIDTNEGGCPNKLYSLFCMDYGTSILCYSHDIPGKGSLNRLLIVHH